MANGCALNTQRWLALSTAALPPISCPSAQVDYDAARQHTVDAFRQLATSCDRSGVRVSIEPKPTDPATRFSITPNTATALLLAQEVAHPSFGLTIDIGHALLAGENPAHSIALAARAGRLFGLHLNDAHIRLGAEDGLPFGSVNEHMALEVVRQLQKAGYSGYIYFDTFPSTVDPVAEANWNVRKFKSLWRRAARLSGRLDRLSQQQDALGVLQLLLDESEGQQQGAAVTPGPHEGAEL